MFSEQIALGVEREGGQSKHNPRGGAARAQSSNLRCTACSMPHFFPFLAISCPKFGSVSTKNFRILRYSLNITYRSDMQQNSLKNIPAHLWALLSSTLRFPLCDAARAALSLLENSLCAKPTY